ncbi:hypothetical protein ACFL1H_05575 [Nanoarchaeota archaeon]
MTITLNKNSTFLDDLGGKEREIIIPQSTNLDFIIKTWERFNDSFNDHLSEYKLSQNNSFGYYFVEDSLFETVITDDDIKSFIFTLSYNDYDFEKITKLGRFTGYLLRKWFEKNDNFYINGHGIEFDYLFFHTTNLKNIIVDNFKGNEIMSNLGTNGVAGNIVTMNCVGDYIAKNIGTYGKVNSVIGLNNKINHSLSNISGEVNYCINIDNEGYENGCSLGTNGKLNLFIHYNNSGIGNAKNLAQEKGFVDTAFLINNNSSGIGADAGTKSRDMYRLNTEKYKGKINNLIVVGNTFRTDYDHEQTTEHGLGKIIDNYIICNNSDDNFIDESEKAVKWYKNKEGEIKYNELMNQYKVEQFITLTKLLQDQEPEQMFKTLKTIDNYYDSIKHYF